MAIAVTALVWIMAAVLGWAGAAKLRRPHATRQALRLAGLPAGAGPVRLLGAGEVVVATAVLVVGGRLPALLLALAYGAFTAFVVRQRRRPAATCGCFGEPHTPLGPVHVVVDVAATAVGVGAFVVTAPGMPAALGADPVLLGLGAVSVGVGAALVTSVLTTLPALADALVGTATSPSQDLARKGRP